MAIGARLLRPWCARARYPADARPMAGYGCGIRAFLLALFLWWDVASAAEDSVGSSGAPTMCAWEAAHVCNPASTVPLPACWSLVPLCGSGCMGIHPAAVSLHRRRRHRPLDLTGPVVVLDELGAAVGGGVEERPAHRAGARLLLWSCGQWAIAVWAAACEVNPCLLFQFHRDDCVSSDGSIGPAARRPVAAAGNGTIHGQSRYVAARCGGVWRTGPGQAGRGLLPRCGLAPNADADAITAWSYSWCDDPFHTLGVSRWVIKAARLVTYRDGYLQSTCPGAGFLPNYTDGQEEEEGAEGNEQRGSAAEGSQEDEPRWDHCSANEPRTMGHRRCCGILLAPRLCTNTDGLQKWEASRGLGLQRGRSGVLLVVKLCANAYAAVGRKMAFASTCKNHDDGSGAMCWDSSADHNVTTNARLPTGRGGDWCKEGCAGRECACGARGSTDSMLRKAQGTHGSFHHHLHRTTCHNTFDAAIHSCLRMDIDRWWNNIVHVIDATWGCAPIGRWRWHATKPHHQPTSSTPPHPADGTEEVAARGRPSPYDALGPDGSNDVFIGTRSDGRGHRCWRMDAWIVNEPLSIGGDGCGSHSKNGSRRCAEREGQAGGSGDDGIGGRRIHNNVTNPDSGYPTMRRYGRRGGGLAFFLTYIVWVTSAVVTFSDINPCGREDHRLRRKRANKVRRTSSRDRERRRVTAAVRKSVWVAVPPPPPPPDDCAGPGYSSEGAGLSALQGSTDTRGRIDACRPSFADADLSIVASVAGGVRTA